MDEISMIGQREIDERLRATLGEVDHRRVAAPYVRLIRRFDGSAGDRVYLWDLRFTQPNEDHIDMAAVHSLEHMIATFLPRQLSGFINLGPMGCQTGFYLSVLNTGSYDGILDGLARALEDCLAAEEVPLANVIQCGWAQNHSLEGAQGVARAVLRQRDEWTRVLKA